MNLIQFLSTGPVHGKAYDVTIKRPYEDKPETRRLFFAGYRLKYGAMLSGSDDDIVPVFTDPTKNGKMGRAHSSHTWTDYIISITPVDGAEGVAATTGLDDAFSLAEAGWGLRRLAENNLLRLMREMNVLFPGKKIRVSIDRGCHVVQHFKHGCAACTILAVGLNEAGTSVTFDISDYECGETYDDVEDEDFSIENYGHILHSVMASIADPAFDEYPDDEDEAGTYFVQPGTDPESLPCTTKELTPILHRTGLLTKLNENLSNR